MLKLYNSVAREKQEFVPIQPGQVRIYVCGMTVYDYCHLGHARVLVHEEYRGDLALMYFPRLDAATGNLLELTMTPTRTRRFRVGRAPEEGIEWLARTLNREGRRFGTRVERGPEGRLLLRWA